MSKAQETNMPYGKLNKVLVITGDPLGNKMAGPGIRALNFAIQLASNCEVILATSSKCELSDQKFLVCEISVKNIKKLEAWADVIVIQGNVLIDFPSLRKSKKYIVCDIYDPMQLEQLEQGKDSDLSLWNERIAHASYVISQQLAVGDFFLAASERQRDFWLGALSIKGRINAHNYGSDVSLGNLIDIVPFGLPDIPPKLTQKELRGQVKGIEPDDKIVIWGGGIYNWFDPETLVLAINEISKKRKNIKLFFMGTQHPNPGVPEMDVFNKTFELSKKLKLLNKFVFFNSNWVPYENRHNFLLQADLGVSTHFDHIETRFSFRTRILDYLWAGLPIVTTVGDEFGDLVEKEQLGFSVGERDVSGLATAIEAAIFEPMTNEIFRKNSLKMSQNYKWSVVCSPLVNFCRNPHYASDLTWLTKRGEIRKKPQAPEPGSFINIRNKFYNLRLRYKSQGMSGVIKLINKRLLSR